MQVVFLRHRRIYGQTLPLPAPNTANTGPLAKGALRLCRCRKAAPSKAGRKAV